MTATTAPQTAPVETVTPIRPSEAIRLGCLLAPRQAFATFEFDGRSACVLSTMKLGYGDDHESYTRFVFENPLGHGSVAGEAMRRNDTERWSRERIADWLEGLGL